MSKKKQRKSSVSWMY